MASRAAHGGVRLNQAIIFIEGNRAVSSIGTVPALYNMDTSDAASVEQAKRGSWGGARNWRDRTSDCITLKQASDLLDAAKYAAGVGLPLNRHVTIHWERAGVCDSDAAAATGRFLHLAGDWTRARGGRLAWNWVRENGERKGSHVHILCHFPAGLEWGPMQRSWLKRVTGAPYRAGVIHTARIGGRANAAGTAPDLYAVNLAAVVGYVIKGASSGAAAALGLERVKPGGRIIGKRAATSQNIGRAARARSAC